MKFLPCALLMSALLLWSCSNDDDINEDISIATDFPDFSFLNFSQPGVILQYQYFADTQMGDFRDIASLDAINPGIQRVHIAGDVAGMYAGNQVWLKDLREGSVASAMNFFSESDTEFRSWTINSEMEVFSGYNDSNAFDNFRLRTISLNTGVVYDIPIGALGQNSIPAYRNKRLVFYENQSTPGGNQQSTLVLVNTDTVEVVGIDVLDESHIFGLTFGDQNDIYAFLSNGTYVRYDLDTFSVLEIQESSFDRVLDGSEIIVNNKLYFTFMVPEPSTIEDLPAVYDIINQTTVLVDVTSVLEALAEENGWTAINQTTMNFVPSQNAWLIGYRYTDTTNTAVGGFATITNESELLSHMEVSDFPWNLVVLE